MLRQSDPNRPAVWLYAAESERLCAARLKQHLSALPITLRSALGTKPGDDQIDSMLTGLELANLALILITVTLLDDRRWREHVLPKLLQQTQDPDFQVLLVSARACFVPSELRAYPCLTFDGKPLLAGSPAQQDLRYQKISRAIAFAYNLPPPADAQGEAVTRYLEKILAEDNGQRSTARGVAGPHQREPLPILPLEEVFVWPTLKRSEQPGYDQAALRYWQSSRQQGTSSLAWRRKLSHRIALLESKNQLYFDMPQIDVALLLHAHVMINGRPGSGKTCLLRFLASRAAKQRDFLPVRCSLSALARRGDVYKSIRLKLRKDHSAELASAFCEWLENGRVLLLLDGADEVPEDHRRRTMDRVQGFLRAHPSVQCVVTSRPVESGYLGEDIAHFSVEDFSYEQIRDYVYRYKRCRAKDKSLSDPDADAQRLFDEIWRYPALRHGPAKTPLLLFVLCLLDERLGRLPTKLVSIYEDAVETLLTTWPQIRSEETIQQMRGVDPQVLRRALTEVALRAHEAAEDLMPRAHVMAALTAGLHEAGLKRPPNKTAALYLHALGPNAGLLQEDRLKGYAFLHLTFREYLVAVHLSERLAADWSCRHELLSHRGDARWREVFRFALKHLALLQPALAGQLLVAIAEDSPSSWEYIQPQNLLLAAEVLDDGLNIDPVAVRNVFCRLTRAASLPIELVTRVFIEVAERLHVSMDDEVAESLRVLCRYSHKSLIRAALHVLAGAASGSSVAKTICAESLAATRDNGTRFLAAVGLARAAVASEELSGEVLKALAASCAEKIADLPWAQDLFSGYPAPLLLRLQQGLEESDLRHSSAILWAVQNKEPLPKLLPAVLDAVLDALAATDVSRSAAKHALGRLITRFPSSLPVVLKFWTQCFSAPAQTAVRHAARGYGEEPSPEQIRETRRNELEEVFRITAPQSPPLIDGLVRLLLCPPDVATAEELSQHCQSLLEGAAEQRRNSWEPPPQQQAWEWVKERLLIRLQDPDTQGACCLKAYTLLQRLKVPSHERLQAVAACLAQAQEPELRWRAMNEASLGRTGSDMDSAALRPIIAILQSALADPTPSLRLHAVYWLYRLRSVSREQLAPLLRCCLDQDSDLAVLRDAVAFARSESIEVEPLGEPPELLLAPWCAAEMLRWPDQTASSGKRRMSTSLRADRPRHIRSDRYETSYSDQLDPDKVSLVGVCRFWNHLYQCLCLGVAQGADISYFPDDWMLHLGLRACCEQLAVLNELVYDMVSKELARREVAVSMVARMLPSFLEPDQRERLKKLRTAFRDLLVPYLASDDMAICWAVHDRLRWNGHCPAERRLMLRRFLAGTYPLSIRLRAVDELFLAARHVDGKPADKSFDQEVVSVLQDALACSDRNLVLQAASLLIPCPAEQIAVAVTGIRKILDTSNSDQERLSSAALLGLLDAESQAISASELLRLLGSDATLPRPTYRHPHIWSCLHAQKDAFLARRGKTTEHGAEPSSTQIGRPDNPLSWLPDRCDVGIMSAMLLFLMEQHVTDLRSTLIAWVEQRFGKITAAIGTTPSQDAGDGHDDDNVPIGARCQFAEELLCSLGGAEDILARLRDVRVLHHHLHDSVVLLPLYGEPEVFWANVTAQVLSNWRSWGHRELWVQVKQRARADASLQQLLTRLFLEAMCAPGQHPLDRWAAAECLFGLDVVNEAVVVALVDVDLEWRLYNDLGGSLCEMSHHPLVRQRLLESMTSEDIDFSVWACERIDAADDPEEFVKALRAWLHRPSCTLKYEAARRLCERNHCDQEVLTALQDCLSIPLDEVIIYAGASVRHLAADLLCQHRAPSPTDEQALATALLPIVASVRTSIHDLVPATKILLRYPGQRQPVAEAVCVALRKLRPRSSLFSDELGWGYDREYNTLLRVLHYTGCERGVALEFALLCVANSSSSHEEIFRLLCQWNEPPVWSPEDEPRVAAKSKRQKRRYALMKSLPGRARLLVETKELPATIPQVLAGFLRQSDSEILRLCECTDRGDKPTSQDVILGTSLMQGQSADTKEQELARLYFFFRLTIGSGLHVSPRTIWHSDEDYLDFHSNSDSTDEDNEDAPGEEGWPAFGPNPLFSRS